MIDQAQRLRQLVVEKDSTCVKPRIITVTAGKGGVGKSNYVVNLGIALQKSGKKVLIFDADMGMGNDDVLMGFLPKYNVFDIIFNNKEIEEVVVIGPYGIKLLPGGSGLTKIDEITDKEREIFLNKLGKLNDLDYILMDTGAGINKDVLGFVACSEELIILTTPEPTSLTDAYSLLKVVKHFKLKTSAKVIINRTLEDREGQVTFNKFNNAVWSFLKIKLEYLGNVAEDRKLTLAVRKQEPVIISYPNSEAARCITKIAEKLMGTVEVQNNIGVQDLFKKTRQKKPATEDSAAGTVVTKE